MPSRTRFFGIVVRTQIAIMMALGAPLADQAAAETAGPRQVGSSTGLPLPRYVSLKSDRVNLRGGPSQAHPPIWIFERIGLPLEVTAEFDVWRKVRDADGDEGWVNQSLLSGRRTVLVKPWAKGTLLPLYESPSAHSALDAKLQSGVIAVVRSCDGSWCRISGKGFDGYMRQTNLWGVYPNEKVN